MMKRFYEECIKLLRNDNRTREMSEDIDAYVIYLEHQRSVLMAELGRAKTVGGKQLLQEMGQKVEWGAMVAQTNEDG